MARAVIVFSDGSRKMAHNLDDQTLRWRLRKEDVDNAEQFLDNNFPEKLFVRDCSQGLDDASPDDIAQWYIELKQQRVDIDAWTTLAKGTPNPVTSQWENKHRRYWQMRSVSSVLHKQISLIKTYYQKKGWKKAYGRYIPPSEYDKQRRDGMQQYVDFLRATIAFLYDHLEEGTIIPAELEGVIQKSLNNQQPSDNEGEVTKL